LYNRFLDERTARDIDQRIAKVLKGLGDPEPPLRLELVRDLLQLDRGFYSSTDTGAIAETVHRLKIAGKQIILRPSLLIDVVKKLELKALWVPDRKRILLDSELPSSKQRWGEAHEIGHGLLPWHEAVMHGDKKRTLSLTCEQQLEAEANHAAGRLLFLREAFTDRLLSSPTTFDRIKQLSTEFGNTMTSTLWRAVEASIQPVFGLVSQHPRRAILEDPIRYFVRSRTFERQFGTVTPQEVFDRLGAFCRGGGGPIGSEEIPFRDANGVQHLFLLESFFNSHEALTLGVYRSERHAVVGVAS